MYSLLVTSSAGSCSALKSSVQYFPYVDVFTFCSSAATNLCNFVIACLGYAFLPVPVLVFAFTPVLARKPTYFLAVVGLVH